MTVRRCNQSARDNNPLTTFIYGFLKGTVRSQWNCRRIMKRLVIAFFIACLGLPVSMRPAVAQSGDPLLRGTTSDYSELSETGQPTDENGLPIVADPTASAGSDPLTDDPFSTEADSATAGSAANPAISPAVRPAPVPTARPAQFPTVSPQTSPSARPAAQPVATRQNTRQNQRAESTATTLTDPETAPRRVTTTTETDDYEPLGLRVGSFNVFGSVAVTGGYTDNAANSAIREPAQFYRIVPELLIQSDWSRHSLGFTFSGDFQGFPSDSNLDQPDFNAELRGRVDISRTTDLELIGTYGLDRENRGSAETQASGRISDNHTGTASAFLRHNAGRIGMRLGIGAERSVYTDVVVAPNAPPDDRNRNNTVYNASLRLSLSPNANLAPFVEGMVLRRTYDADVSGRSSDGYQVMAGLAVDFGPKLNGEIAAGYRREKLKNPTLPDLEGPVFSASLNWSPRRLTNVSLTGSTSFDSTTIATSSGSVRNRADLTVTHELRRNVELRAGAGLEWRNYSGDSLREFTARFNAGVAWNINRNVALVAGYTHESRDSTAEGGDYTTNTVEIGLRLRH